jgi:hypothetical protein
MAGKLRLLRFRLGTLLLFTAAAAMFLGYAHWRRQWMWTEIQSLRTEGVVVTPKKDWVDRVWLRVEDLAVIYSADESLGVRRLGSKLYNWAKGEGVEHYASLERRCQRLGTKQPALMILRKDQYSEVMEAALRMDE